MNLSVPYGFRFEDPDLARIMGVLHAYHPIIHELSYVATRDFLARHCANAIDKAALKGRTLAAPFDEACAHLHARRERVRLEGMSDPQVDFSFEVTVVPHEGDAYGLAVTEQRGWAKDFIASPGILDFRYWSGGDEDRPPGVSLEEWRSREATWTAIVRRDPAFRISAIGIAHAFPESLDFPSVEEVVSAIPSLEDRLRRYARESVMETQAARFHSQGVDAGAAVLRAVEWEASDEGRAEALRVRERLRERIKPVLDLSDVVGCGGYAGPSPTS